MPNNGRRTLRRTVSTMRSAYQALNRDLPELDQLGGLAVAKQGDTFTNALLRLLPQLLRERARIA